jgi:four helix bundle protein
MQPPKKWSTTTLINFRTSQHAVTFYRATRQLKLAAHLRNQLERAAASVVLNLAEGSERQTTADKRKFYNIALGSLRECQAILDLTESTSAPSRKLADKVGASLWNLIQST